MMPYTPYHLMIIINWRSLILVPLFYLSSSIWQAYSLSSMIEPLPTLACDSWDGTNGWFYQDETETHTCLAKAQLVKSYPSIKSISCHWRTKNLKPVLLNRSLTSGLYLIYWKALSTKSLAVKRPISQFMLDASARTVTPVKPVWKLKDLTT